MERQTSAALTAELETIKVSAEVTSVTCDAGPCGEKSYIVVQICSWADRLMFC